MAQITIKLEGVSNVKKFFNEKRTQIIDSGENVIQKYNKIIIQLAVSKIKQKTGEMASLIKGKIDGKGKNYVVAHVGVKDEWATQEQAIAWNAYEYGHAAPGDARGEKIVAGSGVLRSSLDQIKRPFKKDMQIEIQRICSDYQNVTNEQAIFDMFNK